MANNFANIEKYLVGRVDEVYVKESLTQRLLGASDFQLNFIDNKILKVFRTAATGTTGYSRGGHGGSNADGAVQSTTETFSIVPERWFSLPFDALDKMEDAETVYGHQIQNYVKEHLIPETDTYRFSKLAGYTSATLGNRVVESDLANSILAKFTAGFKWMAERKVPESKQIIYVNPDVMAAIRTSSELVRYLTQSEYKADVNFTIERFMGREIVEVPSDLFYTDALYNTDAGKYGIVPTATSKKINYLIVDASATIPVERLNWSKVYTSDETDLGFVGSKYEGLVNHDIFVLENKRAGIYCSVSNVDAKGAAAVLLANVKAGSQGKSIVDLVITSPATIIWDAIGLYTTNATAPAIGSSFATKDVAEYGANGVITYKEFTPNASHNILVATFGGNVVAVSKDFEDDLPVGA